MIMRNGLKGYVRFIGLVFFAAIFQVNALAEIPPRARAVKLRSVESLVPSSLFKSSRRMEFFSNIRNRGNDQFKNNIDVRFKKVMIIDPKKKEKRPAFNDNPVSLQEIENVSREFVSDLENRENELKKREKAA
ncbi:MAG: hypothetical protein N4A31_07120 [Rickettsiales bacterium]|jgi:hypothetical protein|nr:hypothetical protein [Rickettsiales bacterium]